MRPAVVTAFAVSLAASLAGAQRPARKPAAPAAGAPSDSAILAVVRPRVDGGHSAGVVVGIVGPDGRRRIVAYGASGTPRALDGETVFEIGSITKPFTAALLAAMARSGEVALDDPVEKYLPPAARMQSRGRPITLADLATQSSGLPRMPSNVDPADPSNPYADYGPDRLYAFLASYAPAREPGAEFEYSNLGFGLLGHALSLRAGADFETALRRRVLDSLGMHDTRAALTPSMRARLAVGHDGLGRPTGGWDFAALAGAGALRSTANDVLTFVAANMAADLDSTRGPLAPALRDTHARRRSAGGTMGIGLAWHLRPTPDGDTIVWHNGGTGGYHAFAGYDARRRTAVVVLTNSSAGEDDVGFHLLSPSFAPARAPVAVRPAVLDRYAGEYALSPTFRIVVTREPLGLAIQATGQPKVPIFATAEREFFLDAADAQITFQVDAAGRATGLVLHQGGADAPAPKVR